MAERLRADGVWLLDARPWGFVVICKRCGDPATTQDGWGSWCDKHHAYVPLSFSEWGHRYPEAALELRAVLRNHLREGDDDVEALGALESLADEIVERVEVEPW